MNKPERGRERENKIKQASKSVHTAMEAAAAAAAARRVHKASDR